MSNVHISAETLPHWDMAPVFPGLDSPEFAAAFAHAVEAISALERLFDSERIGDGAADAAGDDVAARFERVANGYNALIEELRTVGTYVHCFVAVDSRNAEAQARLSEIQQHGVTVSKLGTRLTAWLGSLDVEGLIAGSSVAEAHAFPLRRAKRSAEHLMPLPEEALAAELELTGGTAWEKLYEDFTSQLSVPLERDGKTQELPMSGIRNLAFDADRDVRRAAYDAEIETWKQSAVPIAACLNCIKGETLTLAKRRKWESPLDAALFANNIDRQTLDAMLTAARESFPDFRRYLKAKARRLGLERLAFYDIFAPVGGAGSAWSYRQGTEFIVEKFGLYSERLSEFAARAFRENWIDAEPRAGKTGGAFCTGIRPGESRILSNFNFSFGGVSTLAHELGHGYHNLNLAQRTPMQRMTPMGLAETASIFCETIVTQAALQTVGPDAQLEILEESLQGACQVVVDILSRFQFESAVLEKRAQRELSVEEFCEAMLQAQRDTYGDGLDENALHAYMWAAKPHYYGANFYNYPYMFGLLFGLGLYARYRQDPERFKAGYDDLLSSTGLDSAANLAQRFGIDITTPDFWRSSLDVIRGQVGEFESLTTP
jgi:pepF/M3 family oligoendopeptidase